MNEWEAAAPIPVLLVGDGAAATLPSLVAGLAAADRAAGFSCAAFESVEPAANASAGAPHLVLVGLGDAADAVLFDPVWQAWEQPGTAIARIAVSDAVASADAGAGIEADARADAPATYRMPMAQAEALPMAVIVVSQLLEAERSRSNLRAQLATERACEPLSSCLDPGKIYPMALELLLERLGVERGIAFFSPSAAPRAPGVAARGFDAETRDRLSRILIEEKSLDTTMGRGEVGVVPWGPLHHALGQVGATAPGPLLSVPLRGEENESGHVWILSEGRRFDEADLACARTVARRASAALSTAERYHDAKERAFIDDVTGVYNARYLLATADNEIQRADRYGNPLSVLFLDLDRFKLVNDQYGHLIGSETLRVLSRLLKDCVRQVDTLARYGGDEFTILLVDTPHDVALRIGERIRAKRRTPHLRGGAGGAAATHDLDRRRDLSGSRHDPGVAPRRRRQGHVPRQERRAESGFLRRGPVGIVDALAGRLAQRRFAPIRTVCGPGYGLTPIGPVAIQPADFTTFSGSGDLVEPYVPARFPPRQLRARSSSSDGHDARPRRFDPRPPTPPPRRSRPTPRRRPGWSLQARRAAHAAAPRPASAHANVRTGERRGEPRSGATEPP